MIPNPATSTPAAPQAPSLHARGLALFSTLMALAEIILTHIVDLLAGSHALPNAKSLSLLGKAIGCLYSLSRLYATLLRAPQHFTARQVLRLSQAFEKIRYLTGRAFDFSPWTSLTPDQLDSQKSPSPSSGNLQSSICNPQSAIPSAPATPPVAPVPKANAVPAATVTATPGATLARICENLVELAEELGLPHTFQTGFLPVQSPSPSPSQSEILNLKSEIPFSPSPSQSSSNPQSGNPQSSPVHPVHNVHSVHSSHPSHSSHSAFPIPHSSPLSPALRRQLTAPIRAPD